MPYPVSVFICTCGAGGLSGNVGGADLGFLGGLMAVSYMVDLCILWLLSIGYYGCA